MSTSVINERASALVVRHETCPDFVETARLAREAFESDGDGFVPQHLQWLYECAFSAGTDVLSLYAEDRKVGQVALVRQTVRVGGERERAIALMDLFILHAFRSREAIAALYGEVERFCLRTGVRFILAVPNEKAAGVNRRYLKLQPFLTLDIRVGLALPIRSRRVRTADVRTLGRADGLALFHRFLPREADGLSWTPESLWERLQDPCSRFAIHTTADLLLVSSRRTVRSVPHTLLCAFFLRPSTRTRRRDVAALTSSACRCHRRPVFVYAGLNASIPLPGWPLPGRLRPSAMVVQLRDFVSGPQPAQFERFEALDFDFA